MKKLTEEQAINRLKNLAKVWPDTLWLYSAGGCLNVVKKNSNNERAMDKSHISPGPGYDQSYSLETINIENDGGDW